MKEKMMFDEFKKAVVEGIRNWLPENFEVADVQLNVVKKNNDVKLTGLTIQGVGQKVTPVIYLENFYEYYKDGMDMDTILRKIAEIRMENDNDNIMKGIQVLDFSAMKYKLFPRLLSAEWNQDILRKRPHIFIEDLAVTFYIDMGHVEQGTMSIPVTYQMMESWGKTEDELYHVAVDNLSELNEGTFDSLYQVMRELLKVDAPAEMMDLMIPEDEKVFVLSKRDKVYGASMLLDKQMMKKVIDQIGENFLILPSSIHECLIVVPSYGMEPDDYKDMVCSVNATSVEEEERLSNNVYRYSLEEGLKLVK